MHRVSTGIACVLSALAVGCTTLPADYAATLASADPKWDTPGCAQARQAAANYEDKRLGLGLALLMGPYGLALAAASQEQSVKRRKAVARDLHMNCSSEPLPKDLEPGRPSAS